MKSENQLEKFNNTERELNHFEQKKILEKIWSEMIISPRKSAKSIEKMTRPEIKHYLFKSVMEDIEIFSQELGIQIDIELIDKIQKEKNLEEKSALELTYIKQIHDQISNIIEKFDESIKSTKWDSWPKKMRESKQFNCVGATLLGIYFLEKANIKSFYGNPYGHAVNIVKLTNGKWYYVDFRNGKDNIIKLKHPKKIDIADTKILQINQVNIDYKLIPFYYNSAIIGSILKNLSVLKQEAKSKPNDNESTEVEEAKDFFKKYQDILEKINFSKLVQWLYPEITEIDETEEMKKEETRVKLIRNLEKSIRNYVKTLNPQENRTLKKEMQTKRKDIENFLNEGNKPIQNTSLNLNKLLQLILFNLKDAKEKQPELYQEAIDMFISKIENS